jgi:hypothetical protein
MMHFRVMDGSAIIQAVGSQLYAAGPEFNLRTIHVEFMDSRVALIHFSVNILVFIYQSPYICPHPLYVF